MRKGGREKEGGREGGRKGGREKEGGGKKGGRGGGRWDKFFCLKVNELQYIGEP